MSQPIALDHFGFLKVSGVDAVTFLQGYTTCDLAALTDETAQLGALCNIQGRMLASFIAIRQGQDLLLRMNAALIPATMAFLAKYIVFSKAELQDMSDSLHCYGLLLPGSLPIMSPFPVQADPDSIRVNLGNREEQWTSKKDAPAGSESILNWFDAEIEAGTAWVDEHSTESFLPQMFNYHQMGGISFTKGCYLGQEIVARMQYRGELKKRLHRIGIPTGQTTAGPRQLTAGTVVAAGSNTCLAVLSNSTSETIDIQWDDGTSDSATPVVPLA